MNSEPKKDYYNNPNALGNKFRSKRFSNIYSSHDI